MIEYEPIEIQPDLLYVKQPIQILDRKAKALRKKIMSLVRVLQSNLKIEESTWELVSEMLEKYPHMFSQLDYEVRILLRGEDVRTEISDICVILNENLCVYFS